MAEQGRTPQSIFPDYPRDDKIVDKEGNLMFDWHLALSFLFQALQLNFKNEGILLPPLTIDQINTIAALYTPYIGGSYNTMLQNLPDISGQTLFDSTNRVPKVFIITYNGSGIITAASWKTYTIT